MGVYIKGMGIPKNCCQCPVNMEVCKRGYEYLLAHPELYDKRSDDCPLVPVSPHGRLIDADKPTVLTDTHGRAIKVTVAHIIENNGGAVDAVIPAEEGET